MAAFNQLARARAPLYPSARHHIRLISSERSQKNTADGKPLAAIPGPRGLPIFGTIPSAFPSFVLQDKLHEYFQRRRREYGVIYREKIGPYEAVYIHDPEDIRELSRAQGRYPRRTPFPAWKIHRDASPHSYGLVLYEGEDWQRCRSALNRPMMHLETLDAYSAGISGVADDLVLRIRSKRSPDGEFRNLQQDLFNWSLESGCCVLFGSRMGCLTDPPDQSIQHFIKAVQTIFWSTEKLLMLPPSLAKFLRLAVWREHCSAWDRILCEGQKHTRAQLESSVGPAQEGKGYDLIPGLVRDGTLSKSEIIACLVDLMIGAVDTTSNTMHWCLYLLARYPEHQRRIREELQNLADLDEGRPGWRLFSNTPYLKAVIKEVLRFIPVAPVIARMLPEDAMIRGYHMPAGTLVNVPLCSMCRDPNLFAHPDTFLPARWLPSAQHTIQPFSYLPFGFGTRSCIGRRLAELEMYILLAKLLKQFDIRSLDTEPLEADMRVLLTPSRPARLQFKDRM